MNEFGSEYKHENPESNASGESFNGLLKEFNALLASEKEDADRILLELVQVMLSAEIDQQKVMYEQVNEIATRLGKSMKLERLWEEAVAANDKTTE
jgi:hypothetical protein